MPVRKRIHTRMRIHEEWDLFFFSTELVKPSSWRPNKRRIIKYKENKKNNWNETKLTKTCLLLCIKKCFCARRVVFFLTVIIHSFTAPDTVKPWSYSFNWLDVVRVVVVAVALAVAISMYIRSCFAWPTGCELFKYLLSCVRVMPVKVSQQK